MDSTQALLLLVVVPVVAWAVALLLIRGRYQDVQLDWTSRGRTPPFSRIIIASVYSAVPVAFGLSLWLLSLSFADQLAASASPAGIDAQNVFLWACVTDAIAACCTIAAQTIVVRGRLSSFLGSDFTRVLHISAIPFTESVFALVLVFLVFDYINRFVGGSAPASEAAIASGISALQAYAVASVAVPLAAVVSNRVRDLSARGFGRAMAMVELGELPIILGLVMGFLAFAGFTAP